MPPSMCLERKREGERGRERKEREEEREGLKRENIFCTSSFVLFLGQKIWGWPSMN